MKKILLSMVAIAAMLAVACSDPAVAPVGTIKLSDLSLGVAANGAVTGLSAAKRYVIINNTTKKWVSDVDGKDVDKVVHFTSKTEVKGLKNESEYTVLEVQINPAQTGVLIVKAAKDVVGAGTSGRPGATGAETTTVSGLTAGTKYTVVEITKDGQSAPKFSKADGIYTGFGPSSLPADWVALTGTEITLLEPVTATSSVIYLIY